MAECSRRGGGNHGSADLVEPDVSLAGEIVPVPYDRVWKGISGVTMVRRVVVEAAMV